MACFLIKEGEFGVFSQYNVIT